jgi:conjugative transfer signal peptidase TraF
MKNAIENIFFPLLGILGLASLVTIGGEHGAAGPRINLTSSVPTGLYWYSPGHVHRGELVQACLPVKVAEYAKERGILVNGICKANTEPVVKILAGIPGDTISISRNGVRINGTPWPMSAQRKFDSRGRQVELSVAPGVYRVPAGSVFLMGLNPRSWDSRYFGPVEISDVSGRWTPLLTKSRAEHT